ncbi:MAG TPA: CBS domain-containing protein [Actinomycetota bacterium]|nr:CBS domain-containing protein [Actinomycetota bacterium]
MDVNMVYRDEVFSITGEDTLEEAARRMHGNEVGSLVVLDDHRCVGIITERDLTRAIAEGENTHRAKVSGYMSIRPITVTPDTGIREAAAEMLETEIRHLPVGIGGELLGMVSLRDLLSVVVEDETL